MADAEVAIEPHGHHDEGRERDVECEREQVGFADEVVNKMIPMTKIWKKKILQQTEFKRSTGFH